MPKICVPLTGGDVPGVLREIEFARAEGADMVEWRYDLFGGEAGPTKGFYNAYNAVLQAAGELSLILTLRSRAEGGKGAAHFTPAGAEAQQQDENAAAMLMALSIDGVPPDYMDMELGWREEIRESIMLAAKACQSGVILSRHYFSHTPADAEMLADLRAMAVYATRHPGVQVIPKLAVMPESFADTLRLMGVTHRFAAEFAGPVITMAMGRLGAVSRIAGRCFGANLTFGAGLGASAPGQLPVEQLRSAMELLEEPS